jgi:predicted nucleic acid-binding protein
MPGAAVNTSPLIFLARLGRLEALRRYDPLLTTDAVVSEVEAGTKKGLHEIVPVARFVERGDLEVRKADVRVVEGFDLDPGELSVLRLAESEGLEVVIVDDLAAIRAARHLGLRPQSTPFVLLEAAARGEGGPFRAELDRLVREGYHLGGPLYAFLVEAAEKLGRR